jgi:hypothetical protein
MTTTNRQSWTSQKLFIATGQGGTTSPTTPSPTHLNVTIPSPADNANGGCVTVSEYARHAGITPAAVYKRIHAGQLGDGVHRHGARYLIDPRRADAAWAQHGRPCNSRAAQLEARLMATADQLADELAGMDDTYCRVAVYCWMAQLLSTEPVE